MKRVSSAILPVLAIDRKSAVPLHRQIYDSYRKAIVGGTLQAGQRVPSTRILATELGISRTPIVNAYAQLLAEGYFQSQVGAGTVVSRSVSSQLRPAASRDRRPTKPRIDAQRFQIDECLPAAVENGTWHCNRGAFCVGQAAFDEFPIRVWKSLVTRHNREVSANSLNYGHPMGSENLRRAIAVYLRTARGVSCDVDQIMIVSGSQQALEITTRVLLNQGDSVWMEDPGYLFARSVFALHGCSIVPVPVDNEGLNVPLGIDRCPKARVALVTPSHQYPLGVTMSAARRLQLLDWAESAGAWIIEDDYDSEYRYESMPISSLQGLDGHSRVVYLGTFSKVLFPSLRLGYLVIPSDLVEPFLAARFTMDLCPPTFFQSVLADFIRQGHFSRHIRRMRSVYAQRRGKLTESIRQTFGARAELSGGQAGMHLTLVLDSIDDRKIVDRAARQNLWLTPLSPYYGSDTPRTGFILGFGSTSSPEIPGGIRKLHALLE
jgi:GntR family transcriptional regulator/MocR family aminotransferase